MTKVTAIICGYNEAPQIGHVIRILVSYPRFSEIIVVDDGSTDGTSWVAAGYPVRVIRHPFNCGKGRAMLTGARATDAEVLFFCDADVRGLDNSVIDDLVGPVLNGQTEMMIAQRANALYSVPGVLRIAPRLGGVRAVGRKLWNRVPRFYKRRFMIEAALNHFARLGGGYDFRIVPALSQTVKERKYGLVKGTIARLRMILEVAYTYVQLRLRDYR